MQFEKNSFKRARTRTRTRTKIFERMRIELERKLTDPEMNKNENENYSQNKNIICYINTPVDLCHKPTKRKPLPVSVPETDRYITKSIGFDSPVDFDEN